jgi:hypothetical protein
MQGIIHPLTETCRLVVLGFVEPNTPAPLEIPDA